jgi:hypothetical protein
MAPARSAGNLYKVMFRVLVFLVIIGFGLFWSRDQLFQFFMARAWINGIILALGVIALVLSLAELFSMLGQSLQLEVLIDSVRAKQSREAIEQSVKDLRRGLVKNRCDRIVHMVDQAGVQVTEAAAAVSDADAEMVEARGAVVRYIIGIMVFLGLIGTFWGLLITVSGVKEVLDTLDPRQAQDAAAFAAQLKTSIGGLLGGMSTAFSTSLFGLAGTVVLGFVDVQTRQARAGFLAELDSFVTLLLLPALLPAGGPRGIEQRYVTTGEPVGGRLYHLASQETLGENLRRLAEVISAQGATDEKLTEALVEIRGVLETLKEQQNETKEALQLGNQMSQGLLERVDHLGRHMERIIKETRLGRESLDGMGKALLDQMKLQGEITNKTLSLGFADLKSQAESPGSKSRRPSDSGKKSS